MVQDNHKKNLYRDDILRSQKGALNLKNADLVCDEVRSAATVARVFKGENVDLVTLSAIAKKLGINMAELFIFDDRSAQSTTQ